ncbi:hypothetical protein THRCLA_11657 [Thraustotheca clavata]|uniref:Uncharacterized protein n=1 Tax=Thraustotheca clavata TaxID=74557 RepID=A0A1V9Y714_9STRA|nr:hypothetical protein THRCLA_11657 [Thraustotheca clavata]
MDRPTPLTRDGKCFYRSASMEDFVLPTPAKLQENKRARSRTSSFSREATPAKLQDTNRARSRISSFSREAIDINVSRLPNAPQLPHVPYPVDPYHFYCYCNVDTKDAVTQIMRVLNRFDVDMVFQMYKCKFKCVKYVHYDRIDFIIRLYVADNNTLLVECQRRSGCLLTWDTLYRNIYLDLMGIIDVCAPICPQSDSQKKVLCETALTTLPTTISLSRTSSGMEVFVIMLTSQFIDVRAEGCSAIAVATENALTAQKAAACGLITLLVAQIKEMSAYEHSKVLPSNAPIIPTSVRRDIVRCAVGALANIALAFPTSSGAYSEQFQPVVPHLIAWLEKETTHNDYALKGLQRDCCRALQTLVQSLTTSFSNADWSILINFAARSQDDPRLSQYCDTIRNHFCPST